MIYDKIRSYAKINVALNIIGKTSTHHKIESIIFFVSLHDDIAIKQTKSNRHNVFFYGKFSRKIHKKNTVSKLLKFLDERKLLNNKKFKININKRIPTKSGLGGGSMNAANILKYFVKKKMIKTSKDEILEICKMIGSDVILGLNPKNSILKTNNEIKSFKNYKKFYTLIVKPNFGCSTKYIYSKVRKFNKPQFNRTNKNMFDVDFLKKTNNHLETVAFSKYSKLRSIKLYLESLSQPALVRMTGSGSAIVAYYKSKERCKNAKREFNKKYKNYWCIASKTI